MYSDGNDNKKKRHSKTKLYTYLTNIFFDYRQTSCDYCCCKVHKQWCGPGVAECHKLYLINSTGKMASKIKIEKRGRV